MTRTIVTTSAADLELRQARFLLRGRIPFGAVTLLAGEPDHGKTTFASMIASQTTRGTIDGDLAASAAVLFVSFEDSAEYTLGPRVLAAGADPTRVHFLQAVMDGEIADGLVLPDDLEQLEATVVELGIWLVVIDPIVASISASLSSHRDQHVRIVLGRLAKMAERQNIAVLAIMHYKKSEEGTVLNRIGGSVAFGAAARSVLLFGVDPTDETESTRLLVHAKCNVGPKMPTLAYRRETRVIEGAEGPVETSVLVADGESQLTAGDLLDHDDEPVVRSEARDFLLVELADGPVKTTELKRRADAAGIAWRTLERAGRSLKVRSRKVGDAWTKELPSSSPPQSPTQNLGVVGGVGGVGASNHGKAAKAANNPALGTVADLLAQVDDEDRLWRDAEARNGVPGYDEALAAPRCDCRTPLHDPNTGSCVRCGRRVGA